MAKNHFWKQFENQCCRDFGGTRRFPANQGGALDFETPWAIGQCKTQSAKSREQTVRTVAALARAVFEIGAKDQARKTKWPVVCVKVRRGTGVRSEALFCLTWKASDEWIGGVVNWERYSVGARGVMLDTLVDAVEAQLANAPGTMGVLVEGAGVPFVAIARKRFLESYAFKGDRDEAETLCASGV